ncbi:MAG: hypothetical protein LBP95_10180 [Deltaproteobacteria bacterium]|nr:hypothetical protein [Deltaproteobacteria bacterium]
MKHLLCAVAVLALAFSAVPLAAQGGGGLSVSVSVGGPAGPPGPRFGPPGLGARGGPYSGPSRPGVGLPSGRPGAGWTSRPPQRPQRPLPDPYGNRSPLAHETNGFMERLINHQPYIPRDLPVRYLTDNGRSRYFPGAAPGEMGADRYGFLGYNGRGFFQGVSPSPGRRLPAGSRNWRYVNVNQFFENAYGTDYRRMLVYNRLDSRSFPAVLDQLADGIFGALLIWPEQPGLLAHSAALEKLFNFLDRRITARLAYAPDVSSSRRVELARELVREALAPLVDSVTVENDVYQVSFRLPNGRTSPWVEVPLFFFQGSPANGRTRVSEPDGLPGFGPFIRYISQDERRQRFEEIGYDY